MPVDSHLSQIEARDFTGGLWTVNRNFMPANGAQTMEDCYPLPSGGLRAFRKPTTITTSGLVAPTTETAEGMYVRGNVLNHAGSGFADDRYLATYNSADTKYRIYRMDVGAGASTWSVIKTTVAGGHASQRVRFTQFQHNDGTTYVIFALPQGISADNGTYSVKFSDGTVTKLTDKSSSIASYQNRLLVSSQSVAVDQGSRIYFTDPGVFTNIDVNNATTQQSQPLSQITGMAAFSPGDLIVFTSGAPIYLVQGDLTNYTLRTMSNFKNGGSNPNFGPEGVIFFCLNDGIYVTPDGNQVLNLSAPITGSYWNDSPNMSFLDHYLYAQGKLWMDYQTKAWFTSSFLNDSATVSCEERRDREVFVCTGGVSFTIYKYTMEPEGTSNRAESYTFKTAPMRDPAGRQIEIRQVEVYHQTYNGATSTIAVTVDGVTRSLACDSGGRGAVTLYFLARREELDVQITSASNASGVEAPLIEGFRVGTQSGHYLSSATDVG